MKNVEVTVHAPSFVLGVMAGILITIGVILIAAFITASMARAI